MEGKVIFLILLSSPLFLFSEAAGVVGKGQRKVAKLNHQTPLGTTLLSENSVPNQNLPVVQDEQVSDFDEILALSKENEYYSYIKGFHDVVLSCAAFQNSLTGPLAELIKDPSARQGVAICKFSRSRMILTAALNQLLEAYHDWATVGTSLETANSRQNARSSLEKFNQEVKRAGTDLTALEQGTASFIEFEKLQTLLANLASQFLDVDY